MPDRRHDPLLNLGKAKLARTLPTLPYRDQRVKDTTVALDLPSRLLNQFSLMSQPGQYAPLELSLRLIKQAFPLTFELGPLSGWLVAP